MLIGLVTFTVREKDTGCSKLLLDHVLCHYLYRLAIHSNLYYHRSMPIGS